MWTKLQWLGLLFAIFWVYRARMELNLGSPKGASNSYLSQSKGLVFPKIGRENATLLMLARNSDLEGALESMRSLEDRFNKDYHYPWTFMNDVPFTQKFIDDTTSMASGETFYELIPEEDWQPPSHIDRVKLADSFNEMVRQDVMYGGVRSYHNMCHFNLGFFYKQKRLDNYKYYMRVEPDVDYACDFPYDPFTFMREKKKKYGFVIAICEFENTIPTLWDTVEGFIKDFPQHIHPNAAYEFLTTNESDINSGHLTYETKGEYNMCHFWSNFEVGDLDFFRGEAYNAYFDHLDHAGGFYYERWGDAPVHTIGVGLLLDKDEVHHFEDIGYYHPPYSSCPSLAAARLQQRCMCKLKGPDGKKMDAINVRPFSCLQRWWRYGAGKRFLLEKN